MGLSLPACSGRWEGEGGSGTSSSPQVSLPFLSSLFGVLSILLPGTIRVHRYSGPSYLPTNLIINAAGVAVHNDISDHVGLAVGWLPSQCAGRDTGKEPCVWI